MRRTITAVAALLLATLTACGGGDDKADAKPTVTVTAPASDITYTIDDCKALLERYYQADDNHDASNERECASLSHDEYLDAAKDVLSGHVDDIMSGAADTVMYDEIWDSLDAATQDHTCGLLKTAGPEAVGAELEPMVDDPSVDTDAMAKYFNDEKC